MRKVFPDHWSFLLGEVALFSFVVTCLTGLFIAFFFTPDSHPITYQGAYAPLVGQQVSAAFASVLELSFSVRAGLVMRQIHHWATLVFVGAIALHMIRVFFTGAFRRPRELNWLLGVAVLVLALGEGFTGYSLPDDLLSGTGMRIAYGAVLSIPLVGPGIAFLVFGGEFPSDAIIPRLFSLHILLLPLLIVAALTVHIGLVFIQKHTSFRSSGASEKTVTGPRFWPVQAFRSTGLFFLTAAVLAGMGGIFQINPVWDYGPFLPHVATVPAQPDFYLGWLEGALRLGLPFEPTLFGITIPSPFIPAVLIPGVVFTVIVLWPWIERRLTHDTAPHNLLDLPWQAPVRTATGVAVISFFLALIVAGGNDVIAVALHVNVVDLTNGLRVMAIAGPVIAWLITYRLCRERQRRHVTVEEPPAGEAIDRRADGGFRAADE
jgi:ubiquinol-cytochrome c reductase cytochrome b subunit